MKKILMLICSMGISLFGNIENNQCLINIRFFSCDRNEGESLINSAVYFNYDLISQNSMKATAGWLSSFEISPEGTEVSFESLNLGIVTIRRGQNVCCSGSFGSNTFSPHLISNRCQIGDTCMEENGRYIKRISINSFVVYLGGKGDKSKTFYGGESFGYDFSGSVLFNPHSRNLFCSNDFLSDENVYYGTNMNSDIEFIGENPCEGLPTSLRGVGNDNFEKLKITVYPNPVKVNEYFKISISSSVNLGDFLVEIVDGIGRSISVHKFDNTKFDNLELKAPPAKGFYFLKITSNGFLLQSERILVR